MRAVLRREREGVQSDLLVTERKANSPAMAVLGTQERLGNARGEGTMSEKFKIERCEERGMKTGRITHYLRL